MKPVIIEHLNHYFGKDRLTKQVLFDINLEIRPGEIVIMTGPSGSGKTTLLSLLGGLRRVQTGSLKTLGQELFLAKETDLVNIRRNIGYIFQAHNLLPFMTAQQNVQMSLELNPKINSRQAAKIAAQMLGDVGLQERIKYFPEKLSGGQKQRVAIARALAPRPRLVLADEPTAALDSKTGREIVNIMHRLVKEQNTTILLVTHDNRILDIADRIIHMEDGRLVHTEKRFEEKQMFNLKPSQTKSRGQYASLLPTMTQANGNHHSSATTLNRQTSLGKTPQSVIKKTIEPPSKQHQGRTYKIVCIDDSTTILKSLEQYLDNEMFNVTTINNPINALVETIKNEPDIVLLDVMMPDINGYEFCTLLRQNQKFKDTPVIMITSLDNNSDRTQAKVSGATDYLVKPFNKTDLLKMLFKFL
ncbi:heterocyst specific ABC-transporter, ATP-binding subunit DevA homolog [Chondrocystis sp. NIES-4102]|nr:heterocyst specific ABC-transporter, ATP-binding subunit DevA homolog [Chondrocystis sp. NIES-4102]